MNRIVQVSHPNPYVLISHLVSELASAKFTVEKMKKAKKGKIQRSIYFLKRRRVSRRPHLEKIDNVI